MPLKSAPLYSGRRVEERRASKLGAAAARRPWRRWCWWLAAAAGVWRSGRMAAEGKGSETVERGRWVPGSTPTASSLLHSCVFQ
jgi:hypothetical protein